MSDHPNCRCTLIIVRPRTLQEAIKDMCDLVFGDTDPVLRPKP